MTANIVKTEGNSIIIRSTPQTGIIALTSFTDNSAGEGGGKSFTKSFRYSTNGILFSDWFPLTTQNILSINVTNKDVLVIEAKYEKTPVHDPALTVSIFTTGTTTSLPPDTELFKGSIFSQFFGSNDVEVLGWMVNVLDKMFQKGLLPNYIERYNDAGSPDDFLEFWGAVCKFFAYYVIYARKYQKFYESEILLMEFLEERGLRTSINNTLEQLQGLMQKYNREVAKRGTVHIVDKTGGSVPYDGELLRLINYLPTDEFLFNPNRPEHAGWNFGNSSPLYRSVTIHDNLNKFYEPGSEPSDISKYPVNGTVTISTDSSIGKKVLNIGSNSNIGQVGSLKDKKIVVDEYMDYEFSFYIKKTDGNNLTVGFNALDEDDNPINLISRTDGTTLNNYFSAKNLQRADKYLYCRFFLYGKLKPLYAHDSLNLKMVDGVKFVIPRIAVSTGSAKIYNVRFVPMALPYSKGFVQVNNFIDCILKNNNFQYAV